MQASSRSGLRIGIDATAIMAEPTGVDVTTLQLLRALSRVDSNNQYTVFTPHSDRDRISTLVGGKFEVIPVTTRARAHRLLAQQAMFPVKTFTHRFDLFHSPAFITPLIRGRSRHVVTVHDMTFFTLPDAHSALRRSKPFQWAVQASMYAADTICTPSEYVREDIIRLMPKLAPKIVAVRSGIDEIYRPQPEEEVRAELRKFKIEAPYIIHVGTIEPRKNLTRLVTSFNALAAENKISDHLVFCGKLGWGYEEFLASVENSPVRDRIHLLGYVPDESLPALYTGARLCVYPSREEGFGLPPLEAMSCGAPVIAGDTSSLTENLTGAAILIPPGDQSALTEAIGRVLGNEETRLDLVAKGQKRANEFSWENTALHMQQVYEATVDKKADLAHVRRTTSRTADIAD